MKEDTEEIRKKNAKKWAFLPRTKRNKDGLIEDITPVCIHCYYDKEKGYYKCKLDKAIVSCCGKVPSCSGYIPPSQYRVRQTKIEF